jgi:uracil phosphoribosyltransferase
MPSTTLPSLPANAKVSTNPTFHANLDLLRDRSLPSPRVRSLTNTLSSLLALETALPSKCLVTKSGNGASIPSQEVALQQTPKIALIIILRAALAMTDSFLTHLEPHANIAVYHLGLFRDKETLEPVEYYSKLPLKDPGIREAYILDPILATGGTAAAAIGILK